MTSLLDSLRARAASQGPAPDPSVGIPPAPVFEASVDVSAPAPFEIRIPPAPIEKKIRGRPTVAARDRAAILGVVAACAGANMPIAQAIQYMDLVRATEEL